MIINKNKSENRTIFIHTKKFFKPIRTYWHSSHSRVRIYYFRSFIHKKNRTHFCIVLEDTHTWLMKRKEQERKNSTIDWFTFFSLFRFFYHQFSPRDVQFEPVTTRDTACVLSPFILMVNLCVGEEGDVAHLGVEHIFLT